MPANKGLTFRNCGLGAGWRIVPGGRTVRSVTPLFIREQLEVNPTSRLAFGGAHPVAPTPTPRFLSPMARWLHKMTLGGVIPSSSAVSSA